MKGCDTRFFEDCAIIIIFNSKMVQLCKGEQVLTFCKTNAVLCPVFYLKKCILVETILDIAIYVSFRNITNCKKMNKYILVGSKQMSYSRQLDILHHIFREI